MYRYQEQTGHFQQVGIGQVNFQAHPIAFSSCRFFLSGPCLGDQSWWSHIVDIACQIRCSSKNPFQLSRESPCNINLIVCVL